MHISSTSAIEGGRVLYAIGRIEAASTWHPAHGSPLQENWRELVLRELIRKPRISTPTRSFGSTTRMTASSGLTRPA